MLLIIIFFAPLRYYLYKYSFYDKLYENNRVYQVLDSNDVDRITKDIFAFFKKNEPLEAFKLYSNAVYFDYDQVSHLDDVRILLEKILLTLYAAISLFIFFMLVLFFIKRNFSGFLKSLSKVFIISSSFMLVFLLILYFLGNNFWLLFERFHFIFFPQGNWAFPEGSLIITIFPFGFFYDFFFRLLFSSFVIAIILIISGMVGIIIIKKTRKRIFYEK